MIFILGYVIGGMVAARVVYLWLCANTWSMNTATLRWMAALAGLLWPGMFLAALWLVAEHAWGKL